MNPTIIIFDEEKEEFRDVSTISSKDVAFIVMNQVIHVWQGQESSRMARYKAGMKVTTLASERRFLGFKHEVIEEGNEPDEVKSFLASHFGKRDLNPVELAQSDRKLVQEKVKEISRRFGGDEVEVKSPASLKPVEDEAYVVIKEKLAANAVKPPPQVPASTVDVQGPSIQDEVRRMTLGIGKEMATDSMDLDKKQQLTREERDVYDDLRREQARADNIMTVEQVRLLHEERHEQVLASDQARRDHLEEEKRKVNAMEQERVVAEREFLEEKLRKEKEVMEKEREALEARLRQEKTEREAQEAILDRARQERKNEMVEFELRKIDLRMQVRKRGVDYIPDPVAGHQALHRIEQGVAVTVEQDVLTTADVYLLDKGNIIYTWRGKNSTLDEQFFGEEIPKLLVEKRGGNVSRVTIDQGSEPIEFLTSFPSLRIMDGDFARSILKKENMHGTGAFMLYRVSTTTGLLFHEVPLVSTSLERDGSYLLDAGARIYAWHGEGAKPDDRYKSEEIARLLDQERGKDVTVTIIEQGNEPVFERLPYEVWVVIKGEEGARALRDAHQRAIDTIETRRREAELKTKQESDLKRLEEDRRALDEMERIEREMLEKEIDRKKGELTPVQIEQKWRDFRKKVRARRGLPDEEPLETAAEASGTAVSPAQAPSPPREPTAEEQARTREQKRREFEQLTRIELEMLEKKIAREQPGPEKEAEWRTALDKKLSEQRARLDAS